MAMLTQTASPMAAASVTQRELGAFSWFASMCAAFGLLGAALVRDRVAVRARPHRPLMTAEPQRQTNGRRDRLPYVTRCGRPPAR